jgi:thiol-disulfide isomerase/thioredoxin
MRVLIWALVVGCAAAPAAPAEAPARSPHRSDGALQLIEASPDLDGTVVGRSDARATIAVMFASWCPTCQHELGLLAGLRAAHPAARIIGVNYRGHEEYEHLGSAAAVRSYVAHRAPWLRVVPAGEPLFAALGSPESIPLIVIYDRDGVPVARYDRSERPSPGADELVAVLRSLGA